MLNTGYRVTDYEVWVEGLRLRDWGSGLWIVGSGSMVKGLGFRFQGLWFQGLAFSV